MVEFIFLTAGSSARATVFHLSTMGYLANYLCDGPADISISITSEDIAFERAKSIREADVEGIPYVEHTDAYLETIALQHKLTEALFARDVL